MALNPRELVWGDAHDARYFLLYLNTWEVPLTDEERIGFADDFWNLAATTTNLKGRGLFNAGIALVLDRPALPPGAYGEFRYQKTMNWTIGLPGLPHGAGELAFTNWYQPTRDIYDSAPIIMAHDRTAPDRKARAESAYHGAIHGIAGWSHKGYGPENGPQARAMWADKVVKCAAISAKFR